MTQPLIEAESISKYLANLKDQELIQQTIECYNDLKYFAEFENNSDNHAAAFAAIHVFIEEVNKRGLKLEIN